MNADLDVQLELAYLAKRGGRFPGRTKVLHESQVGFKGRVLEITEVSDEIRHHDVEHRPREADLR